MYNLKFLVRIANNKNFRFIQEIAGINYNILINKVYDLVDEFIYNNIIIINLNQVEGHIINDRISPG